METSAQKAPRWKWLTWRRWFDLFVCGFIIVAIGRFGWSPLCAVMLGYVLMARPLQNADLWAEEDVDIILRSRNAPRFSNVWGEAIGCVGYVVFFVTFLVAELTHTIMSPLWLLTFILVIPPALNRNLEANQKLVRAWHPFLRPIARAELKVRALVTSK